MRKSLLNTYFIILVTAWLAICSQVGCSKNDSNMNESDTSKVRSQMSGVYASLLTLYRYIWSDEDISQGTPNKEVSATLDHLVNQFHNIDKVSAELQKEPGFKAAFLANNHLIKEVRKQMKYSSDDYLKWRLRSITANCSSCHTRFKVERDFPGMIPITETHSPRSRLAAGDFLIATRQFDKAKDHFRNMSEEFLILDRNRPYLWDAVKRYLLVSVRVRQEYDQAAEWLKEFALLDNLYLEDRERLLKWIKDLESFARPENSTDFRLHVEKLLKPIFGERRIKVDEDNFITTLLATGLLHEAMSAKQSQDERRKSLLLLGQAYLHLPLDNYILYPELYFTQCINEFPGTSEAKEAYKLLEQRILLLSTGSGGVHLVPEDARRLRQLRKKAYSTN